MNRFLVTMDNREYFGSAILACIEYRVSMLDSILGTRFSRASSRDWQLTFERFCTYNTLYCESRMRLEFEMTADCIVVTADCIVVIVVAVGGLISFFLHRLNLEKDVEQFQYWADKFEMLPMYFMCFYGAQNINTVIDVSIGLFLL